MGMGGNDNKKSLPRVCHLTHATLISAFILSGGLTFPGQSTAQIQFQDVTSSAGPFHTGESWGASWCDINGDKYPDLYLSNHAMQTSIYRNNGGSTFTDITAQADLDQKLYDPGGDKYTNKADLHGASCADWDNDGDQDIFATRSSSGATIYLFENDGTGKFRERRSSYGIGGPIGGGRLPVLMDYNNDGKTDFALAKNDSSQLQLFKQVSGKRFTNTTSQTGISLKCDRNAFGFPTRLFDDGKHLYFCMYQSRVPHKVFDTTVTPFMDVSSKVDSTGMYSDATMADFDNDLRSDMVIIRGKNRPNEIKRLHSGRIEAWVTANVPGQERLIKFKSTGNITVQLHSRTVATKNQTTNKYEGIYIGASGIHPSVTAGEKYPVITLNPNNTAHQGIRSNINPGGAYMGYNTATQEWNIYLTADLVYFAITGQGFSVPTLSGLTGSDGNMKPVFLMNNGSRLVNAGSRGVDAITCNSVIAEDFDNDMDVDLYVGCGGSVQNLANRFYWNNGNGNFSGGGSHGAAGSVGAGIAGNSGTAESVVSADYNIDGFIDILATQGNRIYPHSVKDAFTAGGPDQLFLNSANNGNKWLEIDLRGVLSTRDGFGTKVIVTAGGVSQLREQDGRYHRWSHDHRRLHFGLKNNSTANVRIEWPNGTVDIHNNVQANRLYQAVQAGNLNDITPGSPPPPPPPPEKQISINSIAVNEGAGSAQLTVSLSQSSTTDISVNYATENGTAAADLETSGSDYNSKSGTVTFQAGQTGKSVTINIIDDAEVEPAEFFTVNLSNPTGGATLSQSTGTVTINDNDSAGGGGIACGNPNYDRTTDRGVFIWQDCAGNGRWHVHGTGGGGSIVQYQGNITTDQTISSLAPISIETSDTLTNTSQSINFDLSTGSVWYDGFSFNVGSGTTCFNLGVSGGANIYVGATRTPASSPFNIETLGACGGGGGQNPSISINDRTVTEGASQIVMAVTLSQASSSEVRVNYTTTNGTATAGSDYVSRTARITFQPGQTDKTATITLHDDSTAESTENFTVNLYNATGGATISKAAGTITIHDND